MVTASTSDEGGGDREGSLSRMANPAASSATACTSCVPCVSCVSCIPCISVSLESVGVQSTCCVSAACASAPCRTSVCCWFARLGSSRGSREAASAVDPGVCLVVSYLSLLVQEQTAVWSKGPMSNVQCSRVRGQITPTPTSVDSHSRHLHLSLHRTIRPGHHTLHCTLMPVMDPVPACLRTLLVRSPLTRQGSVKRLVQPQGPRSITQPA